MSTRRTVQLAAVHRNWALNSKWRPCRLVVSSGISYFASLLLSIGYSIFDYCFANDLLCCTTLTNWLMQMKTQLQSIRPTNCVASAKPNYVNSSSFSCACISNPAVTWWPWTRMVSTSQHPNPCPVPITITITITITIPIPLPLSCPLLCA